MTCPNTFPKDLALTNFFTQRMSTCQLRANDVTARKATIDDLVLCPDAAPGTILTVDGKVECFEPTGATPGSMLTYTGSGLEWTALPPGPCTALNNLTVGTGGSTACLPPGVNGDVLTVVAGAPTWTALPPGPCTALNNLTVGTGGSTACLPPGANGDVLTVVAGTPTWTASGICTALDNLTVGAGGGATSCLLPPASNDSILRYDGASVNWFQRGVAPSQSLLNLSGTSLNWLSPGVSGSLLRTTAGPTLNWLAPGLTNQVLSIVGGLPTWQHTVLNTVQAVATAATALAAGGTPIVWTAGTLLPAANPDFTFPAGTTLTINTTGTYLFQATIPFVRTAGAAGTALISLNFRNTSTATNLDPIVTSFPQGGAAGGINARGSCTLSTRVSALAGQTFTIQGASLGGGGSAFTVVDVAPAPATTAVWTVTRVG